MKIINVFQRKHLLMVIFLLFYQWMTTAAQDVVPVKPADYETNAVKNYVRIWDVLKPETNPNNISTSTSVKDARMTTQYLDGLGRDLQTVIKGGSLVGPGTAYDLVAPVVYDELGRVVRSYLPYVSSESNGLFKFDPFDNQAAFYSDVNNSPIKGQGETFYYGKTEYEPSPLNRVVRTYAPGNNWVGGTGKGMEMKYWTNTEDDEVKIWKVTNGSLGSFGSYETTDEYLPATLYKNVTVDEHQKQVIEFKDKNGQVVLKKVQLTATADDGDGSNYTGWLCTYYIYDDFGRLRAVVQPEGVKLLAANSWDIDALSGDILNEQCFRYEYDEKGRMIMKKVPGAGEVWMVYDARDRLVMVQDANLRAQEKWLVTMYDNLNRPFKTGLWEDDEDLEYHIENSEEEIIYPFGSAPGSGWELLTETGYDGYGNIPGASGLNGSLVTTNINSTYFVTSAYSTSPLYAEEIKVAASVKGLTTWTKVKVLGTSNDFLYTVTLYDDKGRVIQVKSTNITGGTDVSTMQYDFSGKLLRSHLSHQMLSGGSQNYAVANKNHYDDLGRPIKIDKKLNSDDWKTIAEMEYDALGQLKHKKLGANPDDEEEPLESLTYDYNIRGWLLGMNRSYSNSTSNDEHYFGFDLGYDKTTIASVGSYTAAQYNGNIGGMTWKSKGDNTLRKYDFSYDAVNRLMKADFTQLESSWTNSTVNFSMKMGDGSDPNSAYDANGNIKRMQQWGLKLNSSIQIDDLSYTYYSNSNKLKAVTDAVTAENKLGDFFDK
ncbi:MAG TPA: DUF6443 domain-containing protein, partial [Cytophagaceae bacterium]